LPLKPPTPWPMAPPIDKISGVAKFNGGKKGVEMNSILLAPTPITKANINVAIDAGHITKDQACAGVAAGRFRPCRVADVTG
jgi:D-xylose transport system substrate-binding protein